jgi:hypothetical protein
MLTPIVKEIHRAVEPVVRDTFIVASAAAKAGGAPAQPGLRATIRAYSAS